MMNQPKPKAQATLGEVMGADPAKKAQQGQDLGLDDLPSILGDTMPELPRNRIGKFRLINALQQRFGAGFRNVPTVKNILSQFDQQVEMENTIRMNRKGRK